MMPVFESRLVILPYQIRQRKRVEAVIVFVVKNG
jgi:hypothetical protein